MLIQIPEMELKWPLSVCDLDVDRAEDASQPRNLIEDDTSVIRSLEVCT